MKSQFDTTLLCKRVRNTLHAMRITTCEELSLQSYKSFNFRDGFGKESMRNMLEFLELNGFELAEMPPPEYWSKPKNV